MTRFNHVDSIQRTSELAALRRFAAWILAVASATLVSGCGHGFQPVTGKTTLADGTPLAGLRVSFECLAQRASAVALTDDEGRFELGTLSTADGAQLGTYQVAIIDTRAESLVHSSPQRIHSRYRAFETSGLTFEVTSKSNRCEFLLDPPAGD